MNPQFCNVFVLMDSSSIEVQPRFRGTGGHQIRPLWLSEAKIAQLQNPRFLNFDP